jgi:hypothetical protein
MTPTDTPRTDAAKVDKCGMTFVWVEFAQELERELNEAEAEVERLKEQLESTQNLCLKFWSVLEEHGFELEINQ